MKNQVVLDIDGCLNDYPGEFLRWMGKRIGTEYESTEEAKQSMGLPAYREQKTAYRMSRYKLELTILPGAVETLQNIRDRGMHITALTSRPNMEPVHADTQAWLKKHNVPHNELIFCKDKLEFWHPRSNSTSLAFDDDLEFVLGYAKWNSFPVIWFNQHKKPAPAELPENVIIVQSWADVSQWLALSL